MYIMGCSSPTGCADFQKSDPPRCRRSASYLATYIDSMGTRKITDAREAGRSRGKCHPNFERKGTLCPSMSLQLSFHGSQSLKTKVYRHVNGGEHCTKLITLSINRHKTLLDKNERKYVEGLPSQSSPHPRLSLQLHASFCTLKENRSDTRLPCR